MWKVTDLTSVDVLESLGEETDGVVTSVSKLQEKIKALSGVNILMDTGAYKDTYTILKEIGQVWEDMSDIDQAALLELMAGKNRANTLSAILGNMKDLEGAYQSALNAEGSALKENEAYLDSIQGRIDIFTNSVQTMWMNFINSDAVKFIVKVGTTLVDIIDKFGVINSLLVGIVGYVTIFKKADWVGFGKGFGNFIQSWREQGFRSTFKNKNTIGGFDLLTGEEKITASIKKAQQALAAGGEEWERYKQNQDNVKSGMVQFITTTKEADQTAANYTLTLQNQSEAAMKAQMKQTLLNAAIGVGIMVLTTAIGAIQKYVSNLKTAQEQCDDLQSSISSLKSEISSIDSELSNLQDQINGLSNKSLTVAEAEELRNLKEQSAELQNQKALQEDLLRAREKQLSTSSLSAYNNLLKTTAANQEKAANAWETVGKILGGVIGAAAALVAIYYSGGTASAATGAIVSGATAGGGWLGGKLGETLGGKSKEVDSLAEWYESYQTAISEAEQEAIKAENKYLTSVTDKNYEKWQKKVEAVNTLQEEMYTGLEEMQEYIKNLEYEGNEAIIDEFNSLMLQVSLDVDNGSIQSQTTAIAQLREEFDKLSKGVDEHGNNIALSADEYSRYNAIVAQVLSYNSGLVASYDAEGNAILRVGTQQYAYNQLLEQSIELLKQQAILQAQEKTNDKNIIESYNAAKQAGANIVNPNDYMPDEVRLGSGKVSESGHQLWDLGQAEDVVEEVIGVEESLWENFWNGFFGAGKYNILKPNIEQIVEQRDEILQAIADKMTTEGYSQSQIEQYVQGFSQWIDAIYKSTIADTEKIRSDFASVLYSVPQGTDEYYNLDGNNIAFINSYIDSYVAGIEDIENLSDEAVVAYRNTVEEFTKVIGNDDVAQKLIDQLFTIDSSVSVETYRNTINDVFKKLIERDIIDVDIKEKLMAALFPDLEETDKMLGVIKQKLDKDGQYIVDTLSIGEVKIAYKYVLEEEDGSVTAEEIKKQIKQNIFDGEIIQAYSTLSESVNNYNEILTQTSEIFTEGYKVTEDYKTALIDLVGSETEVNECFDETSKLIVTNADKLNDLVAAAKKGTAQNIRLAKSQARLKYYNLYKQMRALVGGQTTMTKATLNQVKALYAEMGVLQKTITKYELLEKQLLGTTDAFTKFEEAQSADEETNYTGQLSDMMLALGQAFNTAELGSETAQAAIAALVPPSVYEDLDTLDEKMSAIYDYFRNGPLSEYFTIQYDDDGNIESAEMKLANIKNFIEAGKESGVFSYDGDDWQNFDLSEEIDSLEEFAEQMEITKEMAFAFFAALEKHDINWLNGDHSTLYDKLVPSASEIDELEQKIQKQFDENGVSINISIVPQVESSTLQDGGWNAEDGQNGGAFVASYTDANGYTDYVVVNPVLPNGEVVSKDAVEDYLSETIESDSSVKDIEVNGTRIVLGEFETAEAAEKYASQLSKDINSYMDKRDNYSIDSDIYNTTANLSELQIKKANILSKDILTDEDTQKLSEINAEITILEGNLDKAAEKAYENWQAYTKTDAALASLKEVEDKTQELTEEQKVTLGIDDESVKTVQDAYDYLYRKQLLLEEPMELSMTLVAENLLDQIEEKKAILEAGDPIEIAIALGQITQEDVDDAKAKLQESNGGTEVSSVEIATSLNISEEDISANKQALEQEITTWEEDLGVICKTFNIELDEEDQQKVDEYLKDIQELTIGDKVFNVIANGASETLTALQNIADLKFPDKEQTIKVNVIQQQSTITGTNDSKSNASSNAPKSSAIGQAIMANGTAHAQGSWGAQKTETALTGELGSELLVRDGQWTTIGENGAEFTKIKKGDIIFNHKQTEQLLKNGYVTGRGKAYANGTSYGGNSLLDRMKRIIKSNKLDQLAQYAEEMCEQYEELTNGNVDLRKRPHLSPSYEHELAMRGGYYSFIGSDGEIYASTSAETMAIGEGENQYTIDITPVLENGEVLTSDSLAEYINNLFTDGSMQDLLDSDKNNLIIRAVPGEYNEKDWSKFEDQLSKYKDAYLDTILDIFDIGGEKAVEKYGFSSVGLADVSRDLQNNGSYIGKEVASAIDDASEGMRELDNLINQYVTDVLNAGDTEVISRLEGEIEATASELVMAGENASDVQAKLDLLNATNITDKTFTVTTVYQTIGSGMEETVHTHGGSGRYTKYANGTVHVDRSAYNNGSFGAPKTETALVGELGPEMLVRDGRWTTVGENGAEFTDIKKGDIIFNHKQTQDLLSKGYVTGRGKAYAGGTAYSDISIWTKAASQTEWYDTDYYDSIADDLSDAASDLSDAADEFNETFDWIEVRLEELDETLSLLNAQLENSVGYAAQNKIIDSSISVNNTKLANLKAGLQEYSSYAAKLLAKIPSEFQAAAQDGAIAITEFVGEADEAAVEAINTYREWAQKVADLTQQLEEVKTEIADLSKQKFDNVVTQFENEIGLIENANEKLEAQISLMEDRGYIASAKYYNAMKANSKEQINQLQAEKKRLQGVLNAEVKAGHITKYSDAWYDMVNQLYAVDAAINECESDIESFQNAINDIYWDNFDEIINRLGYFKNEADNLINLLGHSDLVDKAGEWTKEGITSMGLYVQQMEEAEQESKRYAKAIDDLTKDYKAGKYSEIEYLEKLNELRDGQYDAIESYYDAQDAIKDLNKTRVDAIKDGIQKEIDAHEELIDKKKEELSAEKDLYDFQKNIAEQSKNIADIQRKLAALAGDNSASARAKRKQLEAELAEARANLQDSYYERSIENQQNALDKELENFQEAKDKEMEALDEYLEDTKQVMEDSTDIVQGNTNNIFSTIKDAANEYDLDISKSLTEPWKDGAAAIDEYDDKFGNSASSTTEELKKIQNAYDDLVDSQDNAANKTIDALNTENSKYEAAAYQEPVVATNPPASSTSTEKSITIGGKINAGSATIYSNSQGGGAGRQYFSNDPIYTVLQEKNGYLLVRHHSLTSGYTGWFKKSDVKAYAKGTKGVDKDQWAFLDELGPELQLVPDGQGRLAYIQRGTSIIPSDISENLMKLGQLDPQEVLDRNRPQVSVPNMINNEINIDCSVQELVHIEHCDQNTLPDVEKLVNKAFDKHMQDLNNSLKRFAR